MYIWIYTYGKIRAVKSVLPIGSADPAQSTCCSNQKTQIGQLTKWSAVGSVPKVNTVEIHETKMRGKQPKLPACTHCYQPDSMCGLACNSYIGMHDDVAYLWKQC